MSTNVPRLEMKDAATMSVQQANNAAASAGYDITFKEGIIPGHPIPTTAEPQRYHNSNNNPNTTESTAAEPFDLDTITYLMERARLGEVSDASDSDVSAVSYNGDEEDKEIQKQWLAARQKRRQLHSSTSTPVDLDTDEEQDDNDSVYEDCVDRFGSGTEEEESEEDEEEEDTVTIVGHKRGRGRPRLGTSGWQLIVRNRDGDETAIYEEQYTGSSKSLREYKAAHPAKW